MLPFPRTRVQAESTVHDVITCSIVVEHYGASVSEVAEVALFNDA